MRVAIMCATRGRPAAAMSLYESMVNTSDNADLILCVDDDDQSYDDLSADRLFVKKRPRSSIVASINAGVDGVDWCDVFGVVPDDCKMLTPGWDIAVMCEIGSFPGGIGVVSASHNGGPRVNFAFVSRSWVNTLGWYACPETNRFCFDTVLELLGEATRISYLGPERCDVFHENPVNSVAPQAFIHDAVQFFKWCIEDRPRHVSKLREAMS